MENKSSAHLCYSKTNRIMLQLNELKVETSRSASDCLYLIERLTFWEYILLFRFLSHTLYHCTSLVLVVSKSHRKYYFLFDKRRDESAFVENTSI